MSLWSDCAVDYLFAENFPHGVNNDEWRTKDGTVLRIQDMTSRHIRNCMRLIGQEDDFWYAFEAELKRRGENADKTRVG